MQQKKRQDVRLRKKLQDRPQRKQLLQKPLNRSRNLNQKIMWNMTKTEM